jgi:hypothetical protein
MYNLDITSMGPYMGPLKIELRDRLITFPIFDRSQRLILQFPVRLFWGRNLDFSRSTIPTVGRYEKYGVFGKLKTFVLETVVARNVRELFSSNRGYSHFYEARCINEVSRGSVLGPEILTGFGFGLP